ncbi:DMT family transporter [Gaoshiqia sp. Z1-71]|uniref:DMT family transporter n=1 Tax=Gaoshiqia hydrogeniformans TaxID=3290090 RepID=UPI003BF81337
MKNQKTAILLALLAVLLWSTVATSFKIALEGLNPFQLIFISSLVSLAFFFLVLVVQGKLKPLFLMKGNQLLQSAMQGFLNPFLYYLILFKAYSLNPAQVTQALNMVWPITLAILSVPLLGQKITWRNLWAILLSFAGVVFISSQGSVEGFARTNTTGALLALSSSIIWSLYWILSTKDKRDNLFVLFWNFVFGVGWLLIYSLFDAEATFIFAIDKSFAAAAYVGLFELGITYIVWINALHKSENNAVTGNFIFLTPFLSLLFIHSILHETIYLTTFIGLSFILLGIFMQQLKRKNQRSRAS